MFKGIGKAAWSEIGPMDPVGYNHYGTTSTEWATS